MTIAYPKYAQQLGSSRGEIWNGMFNWKIPFATLMGFAVILLLYRLLDFIEANRSHALPAWFTKAWIESC
jgi:hypothetical protein